MRTQPILLALFCIVSGVNTSAQVYNPIPPIAGSPQTIDEIRENYALSFGPVHVDPVFRVKELGVDTNVFNEYGDGRSDFTFTISPKADGVLPFARRGMLKATLGADLVYFANYTSERSVDPLAIVRGEFYTRRVTLFLEEAYVNTRERPSHAIDVRARRAENNFSTGAAGRVGSEFTVEAALRHSTTRFDGDAVDFGQSLAEALNYDSTAFRVIGRYEHSVLTTIGLLVETQTDRFPEAPERDSDSFRVMPGVEFRPRALVTGSAWIGYRNFVPKNPALPLQRGLVSQLALSYTLLDATTFGVTYNRDFRYSYEVLTPYFVDNNIGIFVRRAVGASFDVIAEVNRFRYDYQAITDVAADIAGPFGRVDTIRNFGLNFGYRPKRQSRIGLGLSHWSRESTGIFLRNYDDLRLGLTMTYEL